MLQLTKFVLCHEISGCVIRSATWSFTAVGQIAPHTKTYLSPSWRQIHPWLCNIPKFSPFHIHCLLSVYAQLLQTPINATTNHFMKMKRQFKPVSHTCWPWEMIRSVAAKCRFDSGKQITLFPFKFCHSNDQGWWFRPPFYEITTNIT
jgi:hypothetical protein